MLTGKESPAFTGICSPEQICRARLLGWAQAAWERLPIKLGRERLQAQAGGQIAAMADEGALAGGLAVTKRSSQGVWPGAARPRGGKPVSTAVR